MFTNDVRLIIRQIVRDILARFDIYTLRTVDMICQEVMYDFRSDFALDKYMKERYQKIAFCILRNAENASLLDAKTEYREYLSDEIEVLESRISELNDEVHSFRARLAESLLNSD